MGRTYLYYSLLICSVLSMACTSQQAVQYSQVSGVSSYQSTLREYTRTAVAYHSVESRFFVNATWWSPVFLRAARLESQRISGSESPIFALDSRRTQGAQESTRFFVALSTQNPYWNNLDSTEPSLRVTLEAPVAGLATRFVRHEGPYSGGPTPEHVITDYLARSFGACS